MAPTRFSADGKNFSLAPLKIADFKSGRDIFTECFDGTPIRDFQSAWRARLRSSSLGLYTREGDLIGFLLCDIGGYKYMNTHITFLSIHPRFQQYRLGSFILQTFLKKEIEAGRSVSLTPIYTEHVWSWYHKQGFYVTRYSKATDGGVFTLMNFHPYPTRLHKRVLEFPLSSTSYV